MIFPERFDTFICANGYSGFRSYVRERFLSKNYLRIYNIKGGPGTGKSTLLRTIADAEKAQGYACGMICCSSDPDSLDGVILESENGRIGLLDATAPHTRDEEIPGAIDSTVWLGKFRNDAMLRKEREHILELSEKKQTEYAIGYGYLRVSSVFDDYIRAVYSSNLSSELLKEAFFPYIFVESTNEDSAKTTENVLVSSFGKNGYFRTDSDQKADLSIVGYEPEARTVLSKIATLAARKSALFCRYPSPFRHEDSDRLLLTNGKIIATNIPAKSEISASEFLSHPSVLSSSEYLTNRAEKERADAHAKQHFSSAFAHHTALESIYKKAMDYSEIGNYSRGLIEEIESLLR